MKKLALPKVGDYFDVIFVRPIFYRYEVRYIDDDIISLYNSNTKATLSILVEDFIDDQSLEITYRRFRTEAK